jgi:hypothetical protein
MRGVAFTLASFEFVASACMHVNATFCFHIGIYIFLSLFFSLSLYVYIVVPTSVESAGHGW